jgi:hypothetical protein
MASAEYYRKQAQLFAQLARVSHDAAVIGRYNGLALDYLAKADELEPLSLRIRPSVFGDGGSDMDRD